MIVQMSMIRNVINSKQYQYSGIMGRVCKSQKCEKGRCSHHLYVLKPLKKNLYFVKAQKVKFCPKYNKQTLNFQQCLPIVNLDCKQYTPLFILQDQKILYEQNNQKMQINHEKRIRQCASKHSLVITKTFFLPFLFVYSYFSLFLGMQEKGSFVQCVSKHITNTFNTFMIKLIKAILEKINTINIFKIYKRYFQKLILKLIYNKLRIPLMTLINILKRLQHFETIFIDTLHIYNILHYPSNHNSTTIFGQMIKTLFSCIKVFQTFPADMRFAISACHMLTSFIFLNPSLTFWTLFNSQLLQIFLLKSILFFPFLASIIFV